MTSNYLVDLLLRSRATLARELRNVGVFAFLLAALFLVALVLTDDVGRVHRIDPAPNGLARDLAGYALVASICSTAVGALATLSSIALNWRLDRRQSEEAKLKFTQLELEIERLKLAQEETTPATRKARKKRRANPQAQ